MPQLKKPQPPPEDLSSLVSFPTLEAASDMPPAAPTAGTGRPSAVVNVHMEAAGPDFPISHTAGVGASTAFGGFPADTTQKTSAQSGEAPL